MFRKYIHFGICYLLASLFLMKCVFGDEPGISDKKFLDSIKPDPTKATPSVFGDIDKEQDARKKHVLKAMEKCSKEKADSLSLKSNALTELPSQIGLLTHLKELDLSYNRFTSLPPEIGKLKNLRKLNLDGNRFKTLPPQIGDLTSLIELNLGEVLPDGRRQYNGIISGNNELTSLPAEIGRLTGLKILRMKCGEIKTLPPEIAKLRNLEELIIARSLFNSLPPEIGNLTNLRKLTIQSTKLSSLPREIGSLANLQELNIIRSDLSVLPSEIGNLKKLEKLNLYFNKITLLPPEIGKLTALTSLMISRNPLSTLPPEIQKLSRLEYLSLVDMESYNEEEKESYPTLISIPPEIGALRNLKRLYLGHNSLLTKLPPEIGKLQGLEVLDLSYSRLDSLPPEIGDLIHLNELNLYDNRLTSLPPEIGRLTNLNELDLGENKLTSLPTEIGNLTKLNSLSIRGNPVSEADLEKIRMLYLEELTIFDTKIANEREDKFARIMRVKWEKRDRSLPATPQLKLPEFKENFRPGKNAEKTLRNTDFEKGNLFGSIGSKGEAKTSRGVAHYHRLPDSRFDRYEGVFWKHLQHMDQFVIAFNQHIPLEPGNERICFYTKKGTNKNAFSFNYKDTFDTEGIIITTKTSVSRKYKFLPKNCAFVFHNANFDRFASLNDEVRFEFDGYGNNPIKKMEVIMKTFAPSADYARHLTRRVTDDRYSPPIFDFFAPKGLTAEDAIQRAETREKISKTNKPTPQLEVPYENPGYFLSERWQSSNFDCGLLNHNYYKNDKLYLHYLQCDSLSGGYGTNWSHLTHIDGFIIAFRQSIPIEGKECFSIYRDTETKNNVFSYDCKMADKREGITVLLKNGKQKTGRTHVYKNWAYQFDNVSIEPGSDSGFTSVILHAAPDNPDNNPIERIKINLKTDSSQKINYARDLTRRITTDTNSPSLFDIFSPPGKTAEEAIQAAEEKIKSR